MSYLWNEDELAMAVGARAPGFAVSGISIDTRSLQKGDLFVALADARDGHDFVAEAFAKGAAGVLVSRKISGGPYLLVEDVLAALQRLGAASRMRGKALLVAVTGSVGKTTTKEMLRRALGAFGEVHAAPASFNNHIGVPLTLARMPRDAKMAVLELGMNHSGEIAPLARQARPDAAIITSIERAHIGQMGSVDAIIAEKATIFQGLIESGVAIIPRDGEHFAALQALVPAGIRCLSFGADKAAAARLLAAVSRQDGCKVSADIAGVKVDFDLAAPGRHMAMNAVAALAACYAMGLDVQKAAACLAGFAPVAGRGARRWINVPGGKAILLDESYNASSASMRAAFAVLALQPGRHVAVLGDMLELGNEAVTEHIGLREDLLDSADRVYTCGGMMGRLFETLPTGMQGAHAPDAATLALIVKSAVQDDDAILVKGSYGSGMREIVSVLESSF